MAKKQPQAKTITREEWAYEFNLTLPGEKPEIIWIAEDDERSASYKALRDGATGNIRSRTIKVRIVKREDDQVLESTEWVVKKQNLLPQK